MLEYIVQNIGLWFLAVFGVAAILTTQYYQIFGRRRKEWEKDRGLNESLIVTLILAVASSFILPRYVPYPPFTWLQRLAEYVPHDCGSHGCWQQVLLQEPVVFLVGVVIFAVYLVILWGPWWLSRWCRQYLEKRKRQ